MITKKDSMAEETHYMCDECSEAVTNPICPFCLTTEIEAWLTLYPTLKQELMPRIYKYLNKVEENILNYATACIKCSSKRASVCPYCFTEHVLNELKKISASSIVIKEFFEFFNFDLAHKGYSEEAEKLGVI